MAEQHREEEHRGQGARQDRHRVAPAQRAAALPLPLATALSWPRAHAPPALSQGTWRGEDVLNPQEQTLNTSAGGQGDEEKHLYALARAELRKEFRGATRRVREANRKAAAKTSWTSMDPTSPTSIAKLDSLRSELHLTDKELDKIVVAYPPLVGCSFKDNIKPKLDSLRSELHLTDKELAKIVLKLPQLLAHSFKDNIKPKLDSLRSELHLTDKELAKIALKHPPLLAAQLQPRAALCAAHRCVQRGGDRPAMGAENHLSQRRQVPHGLG